MNRNLLTLLPVLGIMAVGVSACGDGPTDKAVGDTAAAATAPEVTFTSPGSGDEVGSRFTATIDVDDFEVDAAGVGKKSVDGRGHLHFSLDGGKYDNSKHSGANGKLAEQLGTDGKYSPSVTPEITYTDIPAGEHTLVVDLANNDHSDQGAKAATTFTVAGKTSASRSATGASGEAVSFKSVKTTAGGFTANVALSNVALDAKAVGKMAETGHGHLHFELDGGRYDSSKHSGANGKLAEQLGTDGKYSPSVAPTITYDNLPAGTHVLKVYVANNDHSESGAVATRTITVG